MADIASTIASKMAAAAAPPPVAAAKTPDPPAAAPDPKAAAAAPPKDLTAAEKKIWKLKADGEEFDFDATDEEAVKSAIVKGRGADKRFVEAAQLRKEAAAVQKRADAFIEQLQNDPVAILTNPKLGLDFKKIAEEYVWAQIQESQMTPEQKKARDIETELERYKRAEAEAKEQADAAQAKQLQEHYEADYEKRIMAALEGGGVPRTKGTVRRMAYYLQQAIVNNLDLTPADLVGQVRKDYQDEHREMYAAVDGDSLISLLGEDLAKKIRQSDLKRLKTTQPDAFKKPAGTPATQRRPAQAPKKLSGSDWRDELEKKMLGKA